MLELRTVDILLVEDNPGDIRLTQEVFKEGKIKKNGGELGDFTHSLR